MSRKRAREVAMQALFQLDLTTDIREASAVSTALLAAWDAGLPEEKKQIVTQDDEDFARAMVDGTCAHLAQVDAVIGEKSHGWKVSRMAAIDRSILRLAVFELQYAENAIPGVVINEAVELAKKFGSDDSARFINGVLGAVYGHTEEA